LDVSLTFVCIPCSLTFNNTAVTELRSEIAALKAEIVELKTVLETTNTKLDSANKSSEAEAEWLAIVKNTKQWRNRDSNPTTRPSSSSAKQPTRAAVSAPETSGPNTKVKQTTKVKVSGARRVWGTHWSCTVKAVSSAITKLCGIIPNSIKRKIVKNATGKTTRWWFVIHDTEEVLTNLESKWDQLKLGTGAMFHALVTCQSIF
jgi:hypothetical protein